MVQPEDLLLVLTRATPCRALAAVVHRQGACRLVRTRWSAGSVGPIVQWQLVQPDSRYVRVLWAAPIGAPVPLDLVTHRVVLVVDRHHGGPNGRPAGRTTGWELQGARAFTASDLAVVRMLRPLFELPPPLHREPAPRNGAPGSSIPGEEARTGQEEGSPLTRAEAQILGLVGEGLTAESVARRRGVSVRTIHKQLENAYRKIGCHDRVSAVLFAWRSGLLATAPMAASATGPPVAVGPSSSNDAR